MVQQLTIFDAPDTSESFAIGDTVKVVVNVSENEVEDFYYLKTYEGARGKIVKVLPGRQYEVLFLRHDRVGIFRHEELTRRE